MNIVYTTGVFDLFHIGHLNLLRAAKALGDILVVGVTTDKHTKEIRRRLIIPYEQRAVLVAALKCVDFVEPSRHHLDFEPMIEHHVNIRVLSPTWGKYPGQDEARKWMVDRGIELFRLPRTPGISTRWIIERIREEDSCCDRGRRLEGRRIPRAPGRLSRHHLALGK